MKKPGFNSRSNPKAYLSPSILGYLPNPKGNPLGDNKTGFEQTEFTRTVFQHQVREIQQEHRKGVRIRGLVFNSLVSCLTNINKLTFVSNN